MPEKKTKIEETKKVSKKVEPKKAVKSVVAKKADKSKATKKVAKKAEPKKSGKKTAKGKDAKKAKKPAKQEAGKKRDRSFKVIYVDPQGEVVMEGRYCGAKPKQAACKALTGIYKIFKEENKSVDSQIEFGVYETTRGSKNKKYWYSGKKTELEQPIKLYQIPSPDGKKKYCSAEKVEKLGGFKEVFGKSESHVNPAIVYNFTNEVKKLSDEKQYEHLQNVQKVKDDDSDSSSQSGEKKKSQAKKTTKKADSEVKSSKKSDSKSTKKDVKKDDKKGGKTKTSTTKAKSK
jgi:hypothetical protein